MVLKRWMTPLACALALSALGCDSGNTGNGGDGGVAGSGGEGGMGAGGEGGMGAGGEGGMGAGGQGGMGAGGQGGMGGAGGMGAELEHFHTVALPEGYRRTWAITRTSDQRLIGLGELRNPPGERGRFIAQFAIENGAMAIDWMVDLPNDLSSEDWRARDGAWFRGDTRGIDMLSADGHAQIFEGGDVAGGAARQVSDWAVGAGGVFAIAFNAEREFEVHKVWPEPAVQLPAETSSTSLIPVAETVCWREVRPTPSLACLTAAGDVERLEWPQGTLLTQTDRGLAGWSQVDDELVFLGLEPLRELGRWAEPGCDSPSIKRLPSGHLSVYCRVDAADGVGRSVHYRSDGTAGGMELTLDVLGRAVNPAHLGDGRQAWLRLASNPESESPEAPYEAQVVFEGDPAATVELPRSQAGITFPLGHHQFSVDLLVAGDEPLALGENGDLMTLRGGEWQVLREAPFHSRIRWRHAQYDAKTFVIWGGDSESDGRGAVPATLWVYQAP